MNEPSNSQTRTILVTGATGKQGRALISSLCPSPSSSSSSSSSSPFKILALTRNPSSPSCASLHSEPHVQVVQGDLDSRESIKEVFERAGGKGSVWGVFVVLAFPGLGANADGEERQGKMIADLSLEYGVSSFVFSSVERGGESFDALLMLDRKAKCLIERHVKSLGEKGLKWTILRPAFFMENFDGTVGKITATILRCGLHHSTKLQLVAVNDIGRLAAAVFENSESCANKVFVATSDILTAFELDDSYVRATGKHLPSVPNFIGKILLAVNGATQELIADIERVHKYHLDDPAGYDAHLADARAVLPNMASFEEWARERGRKGTRKGGWNEVTVGKLATGKQ